MAYTVVRGTQAIIDATPIVDGQELFTTDTNRIYIDNGISRILYQGSVVDNALSTTSENPLQNKVVTSNIDIINSKINGETVTLTTTDWIASTYDDRYPYSCNKILTNDYGLNPTWGLASSAGLTTDAEDEAFTLVQKMYFNQTTKVATFYATDLPTTSIMIKVGV